MPKKKRASGRKKKAASRRKSRPASKNSRKKPEKTDDANKSAPEESPEAEERGEVEATPRVTAGTLAKKQRPIALSEFFTRNRHLLGFDNPRKALLTSIKEAVDNSLDACEEAGILPDVKVTIEPLEEEDRFKIIVEDNGPGIVRSQIPKIFGKLLYGSKFHTLKMSR